MGIENYFYRVAVSASSRPHEHPSDNYMMFKSFIIIRLKFFFNFHEFVKVDNSLCRKLAGLLLTLVLLFQKWLMKMNGIQSLLLNVQWMFLSNFCAEEEIHILSRISFFVVLVKNNGYNMKMFKRSKFSEMVYVPYVEVGRISLLFRKITNLLA